MTEIPEHLLKRSKERRAAMGLPGGEGDAAASAPSESTPTPAAETAPVAARAAMPAVAAPPPPPKPVPPYVAAAEQRRRIPFWAMPVIALLPIWGLLYMDAMKTPPVNDDVLLNGEALYVAKCSSCHGVNGEGGTGAKLSQGEVLKTFKDPADMIMWIYLGADKGARPDGSYGDATRPGGAHNVSTLPAAMPGHPDLTAVELEEITRYVRETLSGEETPAQDVIDGYEEVSQDAIDRAKAGELPSASTAKGAKPAAGGESSSGPTTTAGG